jgi:hypothetical protein
VAEALIDSDGTLVGSLLPLWLSVTFSAFGNFGTLGDADSRRGYWGTAVNRQDEPQGDQDQEENCEDLHSNLQREPHVTLPIVGDLSRC